SVNDAIISSIDEFLFQSDHENLPLEILEDQVNESINNMLIILETIDITNLLFCSDNKLLINIPTDSNLVENYNLLRNMDYSTENL
ncbi:402_t:CDS:1, partial [Racocetra persica]